MNVSYASVLKRLNSTSSTKSSHVYNFAWVKLDHKGRQKNVRQKHKNQYELAMVIWINCMEFLDVTSLMSCFSVSKSWKKNATDSYLWCSLIQRQRNKRSFLPAMYTYLPYDKLSSVYFQRLAKNTALSTRGEVISNSADQPLRSMIKPGCVAVKNNCLLRSFTSGCIESIRTQKELEVLNCSSVLDISLCYFEATLIGAASVGIVSIPSIEDELSHKQLNNYGCGSSEHVGWKGVSYGYHSNDGCIVWNDGTMKYGGKNSGYGPSLDVSTRVSADKVSCVVGCGYRKDLGKIFFTLNGNYLGEFCESIPSECIFAAGVSLHNLNDSVVLNFGNGCDFLFDVEKYCAEQVKL